MARPKPRLWKPRNPDKYVGNSKNIVSRSSWETKAMNWLDLNESVTCWNSEEISIQYLSPLDNKIHRYYPDFLARMKLRNGQEKTYMIEVKPAAERVPPTTKNKKLYVEQMQTYLVNKAKWEAADAFCKEKDIQFIVIDEYDLSIKKRK
jgi:hypothetical protein